VPSCLHPVPSKGSLANVTRLGTGAVAARGGDETYRPNAAAEAARSRRASRASPGGLRWHVVRRCRPPDMSWPRIAVDRLRHPRKGTEPERSVHRGSCGAGFKHRARDAGELADLRFDNPDGASSKSIVPPERREAIRPVGPSRTRRSARPSLFRARLPRKPRAQHAPRERGRLSLLSLSPLAGRGKEESERELHRARGTPVT
jgi:hypothetical protein